MIRTEGLFDQVTVPFEVIASGPEGATLSDVSLSRGALLFNQGDDFRVQSHISQLHVLFIVPLVLFTEHSTGGCYGQHS